MLYRKSSPTPPTLLLRIVVTAGASALLGTAACSGVSDVPPGAQQFDGSGNIPSPDLGLDASTPGNPGQCNGAPCAGGSTPQSGHDAAAPTVVPPPAQVEDAGKGPCSGGPCGSIVMPPPEDAGKAPCNGGPCGSVVMPPPEDASVPDGHALLGSMVMPPYDAGPPDGAGPPDDAGSPDAAHHCCMGVVGVVPLPGDAGSGDAGDDGGDNRTHDGGVHGFCNGLPCGLIIHPDGGGFGP
jgi:hypothetical protein